MLDGVRWSLVPLTFPQFHPWGSSSDTEAGGGSPAVSSSSLNLDLGGLEVQGQSGRGRLRGDRGDRPLMRTACCSCFPEGPRFLFI